MTIKFKTPLQRRKLKKTNYRKRLSLVKSGKIRVAIRKTNSHTYIQFIEFGMVGDKTLLALNTKDIRNLGWDQNLSNIPSSYLLGLLSGKKALSKNIKTSVLDLGTQRITKGSRLFAALKGLIDAGLDIPHDSKIFPADSRITGDHILNFYKISPSSFTKTNPKTLKQTFEMTKNKIIGE